MFEPGQDRVELLAGLLAQRCPLLRGLPADLGEFGAQLLGGGPVVSGAPLGGGLVGLGPGTCGRFAAALLHGRDPAAASAEFRQLAGQVITTETGRPAQSS